MKARDWWNSYARAVMPADAPEVQRVEMRRAFMAGVWSMLMACSDIGKPNITEEDGVMFLETLKRECMAFQDMVKQGKA